MGEAYGRYFHRENRGYLLLVNGYWLMVICYWPASPVYWPSLATRFAARRARQVISYWLFNSNNMRSKGMSKNKTPLLPKLIIIV